MDSLQDFLKPEIIWAMIGIALLLTELITPGLIIAFFALGAFAVSIICFFTDISINSQLLIFIITSVLSLLLLRQWIKGIFLGHTSSKQDLTSDLSDCIGKKVIVIETITPDIPGKVELNGTPWQAAANENIEKNSVVRIIEKQNLTLKVQSLKKETTNAN